MFRSPGKAGLQANEKIINDLFNLLWQNMDKYYLSWLGSNDWSYSSLSQGIYKDINGTIFPWILR